MRALTAAVAAVLSVPSVLAQDADCRAIKDPQKRLECFDAAPKTKAAPKAKAKPKAAEDPLITEARASLRATLRDPESARFGDLRVTNRPNLKGVPTPAACGTVNAKNAYGGYTGAAPFVYLPSMKKAYIVGQGHESDKMIAAMIYKQLCLGE